MTGRDPGHLGELTFEELLSRLEDLARRMASDEVGIEDAALLYEQAREVHRVAAERIDAVGRRIEELGAGSDGSG